MAIKIDMKGAKAQDIVACLRDYGVQVSLSTVCAAVRGDDGTALKRLVRDVAAEVANCKEYEERINYYSSMRVIAKKDGFTKLTRLVDTLIESLSKQRSGSDRRLRNMMDRAHVHIPESSVIDVRESESRRVG